MSTASTGTDKERQRNEHASALASINLYTQQVPELIDRLKGIGNELASVSLQMLRTHIKGEPVRSLPRFIQLTGAVREIVDQLHGLGVAVEANLEDMGIVIPVPEPGSMDESARVGVAAQIERGEILPHTGLDNASRA